MVSANKVLCFDLGDESSVAGSALALGQMFGLMRAAYLVAVAVAVAGAVHVVVRPTQEQIPVHLVHGVALLGLLLEVIGVPRV